MAIPKSVRKREELTPTIYFQIVSIAAFVKCGIQSKSCFLWVRDLTNSSIVEITKSIIRSSSPG